MRTHSAISLSAAVMEVNALRIKAVAPQLPGRDTAPRLAEMLARQVLARVPLRTGQQVLNVVCGTGSVARLAARHVAPSGRVVGIDSEAALLAIARAHATAAELPIAFEASEPTEMPFADAAFDVVVCCQGLQFHVDKARALQEMRRVLVPEGWVALSDFAAASRYELALADALAKHADQAVAMLSLAPFSSGNGAVLRTLAQKAGLKAVEIHTIVLTRHVYPSQAWLLQDCAGTRHGAAVADMDAVTRATMVREIAAQLRDLWCVESFAVPTEFHLAYARR